MQGGPGAQLKGLPSVASCSFLICKPFPPLYPGVDFPLEGDQELQPTDIRNPDYFHKVVDCQWACPAHTPAPEYIRMIAAGRYSDAYMVNWKSNVLPGILGRTCDRPCEPACRRGSAEEENQPKPEPVAICRLKRVTADYKDNDEIRKEIQKNRKVNSN